MKIRVGFVSNSSSSSFMISRKSYKTTKDVALAMIPAREWDGDEELIKTIEKLGDFDKPIAFKSCNYDTYISGDKDRFYVFTCNNHSFYDVLEGYTYWPEGEEYEIEDRIKTSNLYYWPEYDVESRPIGYDELNSIKDSESFCKNCYMEIQVDIKNNLFCPKCQKVVLSNKN